MVTRNREGRRSKQPGSWKGNRRRSPIRRSPLFCSPLCGTVLLLISFLISVSIWWRLSSNDSRGLTKLTRCRGPLPRGAVFYSQAVDPIDVYLYNTFFKDKCNGTFAEIGANDGKTHSNTKFFEESRGWTGLCVEPNPSAFAKLQKERPGCINVHGGIATSSGAMDFMLNDGYTEQLSGWVQTMDPAMMERIAREMQEYGGTKSIISVDAYRLDDLLSRYGIRHLDFLSIDVEGAELEAVKSIDFSAVDIDVIVTEENVETPRLNALVQMYLEQNGYYRNRTVGGWNGLYLKQ